METKAYEELYYFIVSINYLLPMCIPHGIQIE